MARGELTSGAGNGLAERLTVHQGQKTGGEVLRKITGDAILDADLSAGFWTKHYWNAGGHGFEDNQAKGVGLGWEDESVHAAIGSGQLGTS